MLLRYYCFLYLYGLRHICSTSEQQAKAFFLRFHQYTKSFTFSASACTREYFIPGFLDLDMELSEILSLWKRTIFMLITLSHVIVEEAVFTRKHSVATNYFH